MRRNPSNKPESRSAREVALGLLARREHAREELRQKLLRRGFDASEVVTLLASLSVERLQSDARFAESYVHTRASRGFGPIRIRMELEQRGIAEALIDEHLDERAEHWRDLLYAQYRKRYGNRSINEHGERARRGRFLQQRGFPLETIARLLDELHRS